MHDLFKVLAVGQPKLSANIESFQNRWQVFGDRTTLVIADGTTRPIHKLQNNTGQKNNTGQALPEKIYTHPA
ncbi:hypothetical protein GCM10027217_25880 [Pseudomaricurvus hydrocarbonicus]